MGKLSEQNLTEQNLRQTMLSVRNIVLRGDAEF